MDVDVLQRFTGMSTKTSLSNSTPQWNIMTNQYRFPKDLDHKGKDVYLYTCVCVYTHIHIHLDEGSSSVICWDKVKGIWDYWSKKVVLIFDTVFKTHYNSGDQAFLYYFCSPSPLVSCCFMWTTVMIHNDLDFRLMVINLTLS